MAARTLRLSADAQDALVAQAVEEGRSQNAVMEAAILEYRQRHTLRRQVEDVLEDLAPRYSALLDRLGKA